MVVTNTCRQAAIPHRSETLVLTLSKRLEELDSHVTNLVIQEAGLNRVSSKTFRSSTSELPFGVNWPKLDVTFSSVEVHKLCGSIIFKRTIVAVERGFGHLSSVMSSFAIADTSMQWLAVFSQVGPPLVLRSDPEPPAILPAKVVQNSSRA